MPEHPEGGWGSALASANVRFRIHLHVSLAVRWLLPKLSVSIATIDISWQSDQNRHRRLVEPTSTIPTTCPEPTDRPARLTLFHESLVPVCAQV